MMRPTKQQTENSIRSLSRDVVGPRNPELMRAAMLKAGATEQEADEAARSIAEKNAKGDYPKQVAS